MLVARTDPGGGCWRRGLGGRFLKRDHDVPIDRLPFSIPLSHGVLGDAMSPTGELPAAARAPERRHSLSPPLSPRRSSGHRHRDQTPCRETTFSARPGKRRLLPQVPARDCRDPVPCAGSTRNSGSPGVRGPAAATSSAEPWTFDVLKTHYLSSTVNGRTMKQGMPVSLQNSSTALKISVLSLLPSPQSPATLFL